MTLLKINGNSYPENDIESTVLYPDSDWPYRCKACGEELEYDLDIEGYRTEGEETDECIDADYDEGSDTCGPHQPEANPLAWLNHAGVQLDPDNDRVTLHISVGDERGAFTFTVEKIDDPGHENHGRLLMFQPKANDTGWPPQHETLTQINDGAFLIGDER